MKIRDEEVVGGVIQSITCVDAGLIIVCIDFFSRLDWCGVCAHLCSRNGDCFRIAVMGKSAENKCNNLGQICTDS